MFYTVLTWLIMVISVFLIIIVLVQNSKGGGITNNFSSSQQLFGVRKTTDFLEKATWTLVSALVFFSFVSVATIPTASSNNGGSTLDDVLRNQAPQTEVPAFPAPAADADAEGAAEATPAE